jgi:hypothetical protein
MRFAAGTDPFREGRADRWAWVVILTAIALLPGVYSELPLVRGAGDPLLRLGGAKARFCLLGDSLELAQPCRAGGALSVGLGLVEVISLAGMPSLRSEIIEMTGGHGSSDTATPTRNSPAPQTESVTAASRLVALITPSVALGLTAGFLTAGPACHPHYSD